MGAMGDVGDPADTGFGKDARDHAEGCHTEDGQGGFHEAEMKLHRDAHQASTEKGDEDVAQATGDERSEQSDSKGLDPTLGISKKKGCRSNGAQEEVEEVEEVEKIAKGIYFFRRGERCEEPLDDCKNDDS